MILACIAEIRKCIKYREYLTYTGSVKYREYLTRADYMYHQCMRTRLNEIDIKHCSFCEMMDDGNRCRRYGNNSEGDGGFKRLIYDDFALLLLIMSSVQLFLLLHFREKL